MAREPGFDRIASLLTDPANNGWVLYIRRTDARALHAAKLLQKIEGKAAYCAPRNWRQIARGEAAALHPSVLARAFLTPREALK